MKHTTMENYEDGDDDEDDDRKEDGNNDKNGASGSGYDGLIFNPITTPWSCGGGFFENGNNKEAVMNYICTLLNMYHKLLYAKFCLLDCCRCQTRNTHLD